MSFDIVSRIIHRLKQPELIRLLSEEIPGTSLNSLLLEVFKKRTSRLTPPQLLKLYQTNRFVKPADLPVVELRQTELDILKLFQTTGFEPLELSPVTVMGACSVVGPADQNKILSALRGTEVMADATNAIAIHVSDLKKTKRLDPLLQNARIRFSTIQRHVRTQVINGRGFTPHFKIACLVTSGSDTGNFTFEKESLVEHMIVMRKLYCDYYKVEDIRFRLLCREGYEDPLRLARHVHDHIGQHQKDLIVDIVGHPEKANNYYKGIQYKIDIRVKGKQYEIGDGGFVDWTQQFLQNKKERMLSTGTGFEFMHRIIQGEV